MKAALLEHLNAPLTLADVQPSAPSYGQVLVRVQLSGLCGAQLQEIAGLKGNVHHLPHLLGHEGCGHVEAIGPGVREVSVGDKVVMHWRPGAGVESDFPEYRWQGRRLTSGRVITLAEQALVSENRVTRVDEDTPDELCALLGCGLSTALGTIEQEAGVLFGESVLIVGCGGVGLNLILAARLAQAWPVFAMDIHEGKRSAALAMGATEFLASASEIKELRGPFDVIIDTSGAVGALEWTLPLLSGTGRYIMVGQPAPGLSVALRDARHLFAGEGKWIKATQGGGFQPAADIPRYVQLYKSGALNLGPVISHRLPLDQINEALDLVRAGQAGRILVEMK